MSLKIAFVVFSILDLGYGECILCVLGDFKGCLALYVILLIVGWFETENLFFYSVRSS